jgi:hypothetical protein
MIKHNYAPIVIFTYDRLDLLLNCIESLKKNHLAKKSDLFVYSDGPKNKGVEISVKEVRSHLSNVNGFKSVTIIERPENWGLSKNIIDGVTEIIERYGKIIVLEDDLELSPHFLQFMNEGLDIYYDTKNVCQIYGYSYFEKYAEKYNLDQLLFLRGADCLGWGTWKRAWEVFEPDANVLIDRMKKEGNSFIRDFDWDGAYNYFSLLKRNANGQIDSWAIRWLASTYLENMYTLCPVKSFVVHRGNIKGTHYHRKRKNDPLDVPITKTQIEVTKNEVVQKDNVKLAYIEFLKELKPSLPNRVLNQLSKIITRIIR